MVAAAAVAGPEEVEVGAGPRDMLFAAAAAAVVVVRAVGARVFGLEMWERVVHLNPRCAASVSAWPRPSVLLASVLCVRACACVCECVCVCMCVCVCACVCEWVGVRKTKQQQQQVRGEKRKRKAKNKQKKKKKGRKGTTQTLLLFLSLSPCALALLQHACVMSVFAVVQPIPTSFTVKGMG